MITPLVVLAPAGDMVFTSMPSGATYVANSAGVVTIANGSVADQQALINAGCAPLSTAEGFAYYGAETLANLYSQDGASPYPQFAAIQVFNDSTTSNNGFWLKTGTGAGAGNWTQQSTVTLAGLSAGVAAAGAVSANVAAGMAAAPTGGEAIGTAYIVSASPTGAFTGQANAIATLAAASDWQFVQPKTGQTLFVQSAGLDYCYLAGAWTPTTSTSVGYIAKTAFQKAQADVSPVALRSGLTQASANAARALNFADVYDPSSYVDCTTLLQNFLLYAQQVALQLKNPGLDDLFLNAHVRVYLPRGVYPVSCPIIVPEMVELDCDGIILRAPNWGSGGATSLYTGDTTSQALNYQYQPVVIVAARGAVKNLNFYCNPDGDPAHQGNGMVVGKNWTASSLTLVNGGANYQVNDILTGNQPSKAPLGGFQIKVTSVNGSGAITGWEVYTSSLGGSGAGGGYGAYGLPPVLQNQLWTSTNNYLDVNTGTAIFTSNGSGVFNTSDGHGTGATFSVTWAPDFASSSSTYSVGASNIIGDTVLGRVRYAGVPILTNGSNITFGVMFGNLNHTFDDIGGAGGYAGILLNNGSDCRGNILNPVNASVGIMVFSWGSFECSNCVIDTVASSAILLDLATNIHLKGTSFQNLSVEPDGGPAPGSFPVVIGQSSSAQYCNDIDLDFDVIWQGVFYDPTVSPALLIANTTSSRFNLRIHNEAGNGSSREVNPPNTSNIIRQFAQVGTNVFPSVIFEGSIDYADGPLIVSAVKASFTGSVSGNTLTIPSGATLSVGDMLCSQLGSGPPANIFITGGSGTSYTLNQSFTLASQALATVTPISAPGACKIEDCQANGVLMRGGIYELVTNGPPTSVTGQYKAGPMSFTNDNINAHFYRNTGTLISPSWSEVA